MFGDFFTYLSMILILIVVLVGAYFTTRWTATRIGGLQSFRSQGQKLAVVHRLPLGRDQQVVVVKIANRHVVIGCTPTQLSFLTELTAEESAEFFSFEELGNRSKADSEEAVGDGNEAFSFAQILKMMREKKDKENDSTKD